MPEEGTEIIHELQSNGQESPSIGNVNTMITAWKHSVDLTSLHDSDTTTCVSFSPDDPVLLLVQTNVFAFIKLRVHTENLAVDIRSCAAPLLVASHRSNLTLAEFPCRPICSGLIRCQLVDQNEMLGSHEFSCRCQVTECRGVVLAIQPSAALDAKYDVKVCHIAQLE